VILILEESRQLLNAVCLAALSYQDHLQSWSACPATQLAKSLEVQEFWLPALLSHMVLLRMAVPIPFHTEVITFSLLNAIVVLYPALM